MRLTRRLSWLGALCASSLLSACVAIPAPIPVPVPTPHLRGHIHVNIAPAPIFIPPPPVVYYPEHPRRYRW